MKNAIGHHRNVTARLEPERAQALHATLDRPGPAPAAGSALPPFWHAIYFWDARPPAELGRDGHPRVGDFLPDTGLPRRMWAGGELTFHTPLILGDVAQKQSLILRAERKAGRSGPLAVVSVGHELRQKGKLAVSERQDLVYRTDPAPDAPDAPAPQDATTAPPPQSPMDEEHTRTASFGPTLLFRYSALTLNGHRIHYDRDYCRDVEGYPGLVVHGPLLAQLLIHFAEDLNGPIGRFSFRATAPLFDFETAELCARRKDGGLLLWVRAGDGRQCLTARAYPRKEPTT